jgi:hypothetical protein
MPYEDETGRPYSIERQETVLSTAAAVAGTIPVFRGLGAAAAVMEGVTARGIGRFGGIFSQTTNAAGGEVWTSAGLIEQADFAHIVNAGVMKGGPVNILSGAHGAVTGEITPQLRFLLEDMAKFGREPGVNVYNVLKLSPSEINRLMNGPGTTIGAFCNSGKCLEPFK